MSGSRIGVYGLGVMGRNLAINLEEHGNSVSLYNRKAKGEAKIVENFLLKEGMDKNFTGAKSVSAFVKSLELPRKILIMVKAGEPVDSVINELLPHLDEGDILIDGGNSHYGDTGRRIKSLRFKKISFVGMGVSGGEEGARYGPSLMPGGTKKAWKQLKPIFEPIAAKSFDDKPCCRFMGSDGAGHFVKMVHNGIEYADMQLIAEAYHIMKSGLAMSEEEISDRFRLWNEGPLESYLFEITAEILRVNDEDGEPLINKILDSAGQKGTGKWTAISSLDLGIPSPGITEAVNARFLSSMIEIRRSLSTQTESPSDSGDIDRDELLQSLAESLMASRIISHAEGFYLITEASGMNRWSIDPAAVAKNWQGGCIIRSELLRTIVSAYEQGSAITHLLQSPLVANRYRKLQSGWRQCIGFAVDRGIPVPVMMASVAHYDALNSGRLPANLIQAQRDYFGAHTYERNDRPRGEFFHTDWKNPEGE